MERPQLKGIHHIKLAVSALAPSLKFYEEALGAKRIPEADHIREDDGSVYAYILEVPGLGAALELRLNPEQAKKHYLFDPVTIAVADRKVLDSWGKYLTEHGLMHSPVIVAIQAWLIVLQDPDGNRLRLYTLEKHGPELKADENNKWLQN